MKTYFVHISYNADCTDRKASTDDDAKTPQVEILTSEMPEVQKDEVCIVNTIIAMATCREQYPLVKRMRTEREMTLMLPIEH